MPGPKIVDYTTYARSPLSQLLTTALQKIAAIKLKYPLGNPKDASKDKRDASGLVDATETMLKILHDKILPLFDLGNIPSTLRFIGSIGDFIKLKNLKTNLYTQENLLIVRISRLLPALIEKAQQQADRPLDVCIIEKLTHTELFKGTKTETHGELSVMLSTIKTQISSLGLDAKRNDSTESIQKHITRHLTLELLTPRHPMTYELMGVFAELIKNAPDNIEETISFFNPAVITKIVSNGIVAGNLKEHGGIHHVTHQPSTTGARSYSYKVTKEHYPPLENTNEQIYTTVRHLRDEYITERDYLLNQVIIPTTHRYLAKFGTQHIANIRGAADVIEQGLKNIKSDLARFDILKELTTLESLSIPIKPSELAQKSDAFFKANATPTLLELETLQKAHQDLITELTERKANYQLVTISTLLQMPENALVLARFKTHEADALNISYAQKPLPDTATSATEGVDAIGGKTIGIQANLSFLIDESIKQLQAGNDFIHSQIQSVQDLADKARTEALSKLVNVEGIKQQLADTREQLATIQAEKSLIITALEAAQIPINQALSADDVAKKELELAELKALLTQLEQTVEPVSIPLITIAKEIESNHRAIKECQTLLEWLTAVTDILTSDLESTDAKPKISFAHIDALINPNELSTKTHDGFFKFIKAIDSDPKMLSKCNNYCKHQDDLLKINPSHQQFKTMINALLTSITNKAQLIPRQIADYEARNLILMTEKTSLQEQLGVIADSCRSTSKTISTLEKECALTTLITREIDLTKHENKYSELLSIISAINALKITVDTLRNATVSIVEPLKETLELINQQINQVSMGIDELETLTSYRTNLDNMSQLLHTLAQKIEVLSDAAKQTQNQEAAALRTSQRQIMVKQFIKQLEDYQKTRAAKYRFKDFFSATDQTKRTRFIETLTLTLQAYDNSGDEGDVIKTIRDNIEMFPGKALKPLLHEITITLIDAKDLAPANDATMEKQHKAAKERLITITSTHVSYAKTMAKLYEKISVMKNYGIKLIKNNDLCGMEVIQLADKLRGDIDRFIISHGVNLPDKASYNQFEEKFTTRLHSKDKIMSKHSQWLTILGNIALILLIIPKLIYSKIKTGHCAFFFETTKKNDLIDAIDKQVKEVVGPSAAPAA